MQPYSLCPATLSLAPVSPNPEAESREPVSPLMTQEVQAPFQSGSCDTAVFGGISHSGKVPAYSFSPLKGQSGHKSGLNVPTGIVNRHILPNWGLPSNEWCDCKYSCFIAQDRGPQLCCPPFSLFPLWPWVTLSPFCHSTSSRPAAFVPSLYVSQKTGPSESPVTLCPPPPVLNQASVSSQLCFSF